MAAGVGVGLLGMCDVARLWGWGGKESGNGMRLERCRVVEGGCREENVPATEDSVENRVGTLGEWTRPGWWEGARMASGRRARLCEDGGGLGRRRGARR